MATVSLVSADVLPDGRVSIMFADGFGQEFSSLAEFQAWATQIDTSVDAAKQMCCAYLLSRSPNLSNTASVRNKSFVVDFSSPSPIKVQ